MLLNDSALQKPDPNGCIVAAFHPNISIPAPHHEVQYIEVKPHNEKPVSDYSLEIYVVKVEQQLACLMTRNNNEIKMERCE